MKEKDGGRELREREGQKWPSFLWAKLEIIKFKVGVAFLE
jgi:hypothetical protein